MTERDQDASMRLTLAELSKQLPGTDERAFYVGLVTVVHGARILRLPPGAV